MSDTPYPEAQRLLEEAITTITTDRRDSYGDWRSEAERVADLWNAYLQQRPVRGSDVGPLMILLKLARHSVNQFHIDNLVDVIGYAALTAESVSLEQSRKGWSHS